MILHDPKSTIPLLAAYNQPVMIVICRPVKKEESYIDGICSRYYL